jgi:hypothetical protein
VLTKPSLARRPLLQPGTPATPAGVFVGLLDDPAPAPPSPYTRSMPAPPPLVPPPVPTLVPMGELLSVRRAAPHLPAPPPLAAYSSIASAARSHVHAHVLEPLHTVSVGAAAPPLRPAASWGRTPQELELAHARSSDALLGAVEAPRARLPLPHSISLQPDADEP